MVEGVDWYWVATGHYQGNGTGRVLNMLEFTARTWLHAQRLADEQKPDVVIASSTYPLDIYAAARIARRACASLVFEVHDMWPLTPQLLGQMSRRHPFVWLLQRAEDYYCRRADLVISVLPNAIEHLSTRGLTSERYAVVPNGVDLTVSPHPDDVPAEHLSIFEKARAEGRVIVLYAGSLGLSNRVDVLVRAAGLVGDTPVQVVIVGQGPEKEALKHLAAELQLTNVSFPAPVSRSQLHGLLALSDIAYAGVGQSPLYRYGISLNKLLEYMTAGTCVLFAGSADVFNDVVSESRAGLSVAHALPEDVAGGIRSLCRLTHEERAELGRKGSEYCRAHFSYAVLAERYEGALARAREHRRHR
jgi:glycosyltransferase involved in cell wall biosynthesis